MRFSTIGVAFSLLIGQVPSGDYRATPDLRCGSKCLFVALKALDLSPRTLADLERKLGPPGDLGYSMRQLDEQAQAYGARTLAVETSLDNLSRRPEPFVCLTLISPNHFILLYDIDEKYAYIIDSPRIVKLPRDTFNNFWLKKALLVGKQPFASEDSLNSRWLSSRWLLILAAVVGLLGVFLGIGRARWLLRRNTALSCALLHLVFTGAGCGGHRDGPDQTDVARYKQAEYSGGALRLEPRSHRLGRLNSSKVTEAREVITTVFNDGSDALVIKSITRGCTCTDVAIGNDVILPGSQTTIRAKIRLGASAEPRVARINLSTSDPLKPSAEVAFEWQVVNPLRIEPAVYDRARLNPGEGTTAQFAIRGHGLSICKECELRAVSESNLVTCTVTPGSDFAPDHSDVADDVDRALGSLELKLAPAEDNAFFRQSITISLHCRGAEKARVLLPVTWRVGQPLDLFPTRLSLGRCALGESFGASFLVSSPQRVPFRVLSCQSDDPNLTIESELPSDPEVNHKCSIRFRTPRSLGPWGTVLRIETDLEGARIASLPVSALVIARQGN